MNLLPMSPAHLLPLTPLRTLAREERGDSPSSTPDGSETHAGSRAFPLRVFS